MHKVNHHIELCSVVLVLCLLNIVLTTGIVLASNTTTAESSTSTASVTVPEACTMTSTNNTPHTATLSPNTYSGASGSDYQNGIGKTTLTVVCNDYNGFSIYAIGFTGNSYDSENHTKLVGNTTGNAISTKVYASTDNTSNWSMKVTKVTDSSVSYNPTNMSIQNSFDDWHEVPDTYTKVAQYKASTGSSTTDTTLGAKVETTYAAYIAENQSADTYIGQVKYVMIHPYDGDDPKTPQPSTPGYIYYYANANNVIGTMGRRAINESTTTVTLVPSNYSREGYGFAGWSDAYDYLTNPNANLYGPSELIELPDDAFTNGLNLYAIWIKSAGNLRDTNLVAALCGTGAGSLTAAVYSDKNDDDESTWSVTAGLSSVSALTDDRDGQTYAIAKLPDGRCWMVENLRLAGTHQEGGNTVPTTLTIVNTNNPLNDGTNVILKHNYSDTETYSTLPASSSNWCTNNNATCDNQSRIRSDNITDRVYFNETDTMNVKNNFYSYGNYYNWYSAMAGTGVYGSSTGIMGDLCPSGWHVPSGNSYGEFGVLSNSMGGLRDENGGAQTMNYSSTPHPYIMQQRFYHFPNNFLSSGGVIGSNINDRGSSGTFWSSTSQYDAAHELTTGGMSFSPGTNAYYKYSGRTVRCIANI